jgi:hypothetical protein
MDISLKGLQLPRPSSSPRFLPDPVGMPRIDFGVARLRVEYLQHNWRERLIPLEELAILCKISQTAGYSRMFFRAYEIVNAKRSSMAKADIMLFDLLHLKLLLQRGAWIGAAAQVKDIEKESDWSRLLGVHSQLGAYTRRKLLIRAYSEQPNAIDIDLEVLGEDTRYQIAANDLFGQIALLYSSMSADALAKLSSKLTILRNIYYVDTENADSNEVRYEKSAIALLYLEAAAYLKWGSHDFRERVMKLLYVAHILNVRIGGNESSELNGEILNSCTEPAHRTILALAMRRDDDAIIRMREFVRQQHFSWAVAVGRNATESLSMRPKDRGKKISEIIG